MSKTDELLQARAVDGDSSMEGTCGTNEDVKDMFRLGRTQELKVSVFAHLAFPFVTVFHLKPC